MICRTTIPLSCVNHQVTQVYNEISPMLFSLNCFDFKDIGAILSFITDRPGLGFNHLRPINLNVEIHSCPQTFMVDEEDIQCNTSVERRVPLIVVKMWIANSTRRISRPSSRTSNPPANLQRIKRKYGSLT